jgi:tetratricopeptide (TPR) repeat protein
MPAPTDAAMRRLEIDGEAERAYGLRYADTPDAIRMADAALAKAREDGYTLGIARALVAAGAARGWIGEIGSADRALREALEIFDGHPDPLGQARACAWQGLLARHRAHYPVALRHCTNALTIFMAEGDRAGELEVKRMIGMVHALAGDFVSALERFTESLRIAEETGDQQGQALSRNDLGVALFELGDQASARSNLEAALAYFRRTGATSSELHALNNLGSCCAAAGDRDQAMDYLEECVTVSAQRGERLPKARARFNLGRMMHAAGDAASANHHFERARELSRSVGDRRTEIDSMIGLGLAALTLGDPDQALEILLAAHEAAEGSGIQRVMAESNHALATAYEAMQKCDQALNHYKRYHGLRDLVQQAGTQLRIQYRDDLGRLEREQQAAELQVLKAQLQPHFLLNSLHSVSGLIRTDPSTATRAVVQLGELLRLALRQSMTQLTTLDAEMEFVDAYLELERVRYQGAFTHRLHVEPGMGATPVPHLLLQPLAENAVRHGLANAPDRAHIDICATAAEAGRVRIIVRDTGVGLRPGWSQGQERVGLRNTRLRLLRLYGPDHLFRIAPAENGGVVVEIELPVRGPCPQ